MRSKFSLCCLCTRMLVSTMRSDANVSQFKNRPWHNCAVLCVDDWQGLFPRNEGDVLLCTLYCAGSLCASNKADLKVEALRPASS